jgi:acetyltransferase-like isoleucine patch superfamily enzyme
MMHSTTTVDAPVTARDLVRAGLLEIGEGCRVHPTAVFMPGDMLGTLRPIVLGARITVGAFAVVHGGARVGDDTHIGHRVIIGEPEYGYAVRQVYQGAGDATTIGAGVVLRAGAILYAGVKIGEDSTIGHITLLRTNVVVGGNSQLAANLTVERGSRIGNGVRCSPGSHLTADTVIADRVFLGAGVRTINDKQLIWRDPDNELALSPPRFEYGCRVGSGAAILAGVSVGARALVGACSVVTRDVPADSTTVSPPRACTVSWMWSKTCAIRSAAGPSPTVPPALWVR